MERMYGLYRNEITIAQIIATVLMGCGANLVFLESIIREATGAGNLVALSQIALISVDGFLFTTDCGRKSSAVPIKNYILLVLHFFVVSLSCSYVNVFKIPMPLIMIFRAGSLIANLILGILILKRRYSASKYISVLIITIGIIICTLASVRDTDKSHSNETISSFDWTFGILLLLFSLFVSANTGIFQEKLFQQFGKHPREALFYTHFLQFPGFLLLTSDIANHFVIFNNSSPYLIDLSLFSISVPKLWLLLILNCLTQYICIRSVFRLTTECTSLTVTLVVTIRKFLSLIVSIVYFQNPFTASHWLGTVLVFVGTLLFVDIPFRFYKIKVK